MDNDADAVADVDLDPAPSIDNDLYFDAAEYAPEDADVHTDVDVDVDVDVDGDSDVNWSLRFRRAHMLLELRSGQGICEKNLCNYLSVFRSLVLAFDNCQEGTQLTHQRGG
jgi:hypothetical protein